MYIYQYPLSDGSIRYRFYYRYEKLNIFRSGFVSFKEAEIAYKKLVFKYDPEHLSDITFHFAISCFLDFEKLKVKKSTFLGYKRRVEKYISLIPDIDIRKVNFMILNEWLVSLSCSIKLKTRLLHDLKCIFEYIDVYFNIHNVEYKKIIIPKDYSIKEFIPQRYILSISDFKRLYDVIEEEYFRLLFLIAFICGLRAGEVRGLQVKCFDLVNSTVAIYQQVVELGNGQELSSPKSVNSVRLCYLPQFVTERVKEFILSNNLDYGDFIFFNFRGKEKKAVGEETMNRRLHLYQKLSGLPQFNFHTFRKSEASLLNDIGISGDIIKSYLGHNSFETTKKYYLGDSLEKKRMIQEVLSEKLKEFK